MTTLWCYSWQVINLIIFTTRWTHMTNLKLYTVQLVLLVVNFIWCFECLERKVKLKFIIIMLCLHMVSNWQFPGWSKAYDQKIKNKTEVITTTPLIKILKKKILANEKQFTKLTNKISIKNYQLYSRSELY